ncbi:DHA2 family efflux MFS transporter permease subunit [Pseudomonas sp. NA-150]|uniref:DHA2 family efflux MFS transporter permease subunit n=1 Tax=Pseudomonas sp. NA-150 TaxID=3367525 RepID=UPI0037CC832C
MNATVAGNPGEGGARSLRIAALLATWMQSANLPLPNSSLRFIQAGLSMSDDEAGWIFTSYVAGSVLTMPLAQWLAGRFGLKLVYQIALVIFGLSSVLLAMATTPLEFVGARVVQGAASGILGPLSMGITMETLPPERRVKFGAVWTAVVLLGIATGPTIGALLSEYYGWHSMYYADVPLTAFIFLVMMLLLPEKKAEKRPLFDFFGFGTFTLGVIGLQMMIDNGERLDWFDSPAIWAEAIMCVGGFYLFFVHMFTRKTHFLSKDLFNDRNFVLSTIIFFAVGFVLLSTMALTSPMLDEILGYPPITTGLMTVPRGVGLVGAFLLMGRVSGRIDVRLFVAAGIALVAYANWQMLGYSPLMDWTPVAIAGFIQGAGLGVLMASVPKMAFSTLDPKFRPEATGFFNLTRGYGSMLGVAVVQLFFFNHTQAMHQAMASNLTIYRAAAHAVTAAPSLQALAGLNEMVTGQAAFVAVINQFKILLVVMLVVSPLVVFLRKPASAN